MVAFGAAAGVAVFGASVFAGVAAAGAAGVAAVGVAGATGVAATGVAGLTALVFVLFALLAGASPQAIPRALRPKTADNTIPFVILIRLLSILKVFNPVSRARLMKHNRFASNSFFFSANERIEIHKAFVNLKSIKKSLFLKYFLTISAINSDVSQSARIY